MHVLDYLLDVNDQLLATFYSNSFAHSLCPFSNAISLAVCPAVSLMSLLTSLFSSNCTAPALPASAVSCSAVSAPCSRLYLQLSGIALIAAFWSSKKLMTNKHKLVIPALEKNIDRQ